MKNALVCSLLVAGLVAGCDASVNVGPSVAEAANLPVVNPRPEVAHAQPMKRPLKPKAKPFEWGLYKQVYCAEKTGEALQIDRIIRASGHTPASWNQHLENHLALLSEGDGQLLEEWKKVALTPCP